MKFLFLVLIFWSALALSQDTSPDLDILETQRTATTPFGVPISVGSDGEISFFGQGRTAPVSFQPAMQVYFTLHKIQYTSPKIATSFEFAPIEKNSELIEVKTVRMEAGLGLNVLIGNVMSVGLVPFAGALHTLVRYKARDDERTMSYFMPETLKEIENWTINDTGTYQRYGGVTLQAALPTGMLRVISGDVSLQNLFLVNIQRTSFDDVRLTISEEHLNRKSLILGPVLAKGTYGFFKGNKFTATFDLKLSVPEHHKLFEEAIRGNLKHVQEALETERQSLTWQGKDRQFYYGIPGMAGSLKNISHYDFSEDGVDTKLDMRTAGTMGILVPFRKHQTYSYATENNMVVVWSSQMNRATSKVVEKRFLSVGRTMNVKGFQNRAPEHTKFGSVISHIGFTVSRKEIEAMQNIDLDVVRFHFQERCEEEVLPCADDSHALKVMKKVREFLHMPWMELKKELGFLLLKEPALAYAVVKTMNVKKKVYFKFLSEKFQSLEGVSSIEI